jgi:Holliday junction resolvase RusA-like endonuclease
MVALATIAAPIVTVLDLPVPPSVNRIWRYKVGKAKVNRSPEYEAWIKQADLAVVVDHALRGRRRINGPFSALIEVERPSANSDIDNRIKALLDFAQSRGFVSDDKHLIEVTARWSLVGGRGCRLTLREAA